MSTRIILGGTAIFFIITACYRRGIIKEHPVIIQSPFIFYCHYQSFLIPLKKTRKGEKNTIYPNFKKLFNKTSKICLSITR